MRRKICTKVLHICLKCLEKLLWNNFKSSTALKSSKITSSIIQICCVELSSSNTTIKPQSRKHQDSTGKKCDIKYRNLQVINCQTCSSVSSLNPPTRWVLTLQGNSPKLDCGSTLCHIPRQVRLYRQMVISRHCTDK